MQCNVDASEIESQIEINAPMDMMDQWLLNTRWVDLITAEK